MALSVASPGGPGGYVGAKAHGFVPDPWAGRDASTDPSANHLAEHHYDHGDIWHHHHRRHHHVFHDHHYIEGLNEVLNLQGANLFAVRILPPSEDKNQGEQLLKWIAAQRGIPFGIAYLPADQPLGAPGALPTLLLALPNNSFAAAAAAALSPAGTHSGSPRGPGGSPSLRVPSLKGGPPPYAGASPLATASTASFADFLPSLRPFPPQLLSTTPVSPLLGSPNADFPVFPKWDGLPDVADRPSGPGGWRGVGARGNGNGGRGPSPGFGMPSEGARSSPVSLADSQEQPPLPPHQKQQQQQQPEPEPEQQEPPRAQVEPQQEAGDERVVEGEEDPQP